MKFFKNVFMLVVFLCLTVSIAVYASDIEDNASIETADINTETSSDFISEKYNPDENMFNFIATEKDYSNTANLKISLNSALYEVGRDLHVSFTASDSKTPLYNAFTAGDITVENVELGKQYSLVIKSQKEADILCYLGNIKVSRKFDETTKNSYLDCQYTMFKERYKDKSYVDENIPMPLVVIRSEEEPNDDMYDATSMFDDDSVIGMFESETDVDYYKVTFYSAGNANFWLGNIPDDSDYDFYLYNEDGVEIASSTSTTFQEMIYNQPVSANSTYYMKVEFVTGVICEDVFDTNYQYTVRAKNYNHAEDSTDDSAYTESILVENSTYGSYNDVIDYGGDVDFFKITVSESGVYNIRTTGNLDTYGILYEYYNFGETELREIQRDDDGGVGSNFSINVELTSDSKYEYYIGVSAYDASDTGHYTVICDVAEDEAGDTFETAATISAPGSLRGYLDSSMDVDCYEFDISTNGIYKILVQCYDDIQGMLYISNGQSVCDIDKENFLTYSVELPISVGKYYFEVYGTEDIELYYIEIIKISSMNDSYEPNTNKNTAAEIGFEAITAEITENDQDTYYFYIPDDAYYYFYIRSDFEMTYGGSSYNPDDYQVLSLEVEDPFAILTASEYENEKFFYLKLRKNSYYSIWLSGFEGGTGEYEFQIVKNGIDDHPNSFENLTNNQVLSSSLYQIPGRVGYEGDTDCFKFTPDITGSYNIYSTGTKDLMAILYDTDKITPISTSYDEPNSTNFKVARTLEGGKTYYLKVQCENLGIGNYTLNFERIQEPDDAYFSYQWGLLNRGGFSTSSGNVTTTTGIDINVLPVWEYTKGDGIKVAVIDSGVDYTHDDLDNNLILPGINTVHGGTDISPTTESIAYDSKGNSFGNAASEGHGTHVSGILSAIGDNSKGIIGVAPHAKIIPIKSVGTGLIGTLDAGYNLSTEKTLLDGIEYAIDNDADIINMSLQHFEYNNVTEEVINAATDVLFVSIAGNDGLNLSGTDVSVQYPGMYDSDNLITVASMDYDGNLSSFSNYNGKTHIAAPGESILSTYPISSNDAYIFDNGTSMAAPHVSGVAALIWSYYPDLTAAQLKQRLVSENNVSYNSKLSGKVSSNGYLNAWYAFTSDSSTPRTVSTRNINETENDITVNKAWLSQIKAKKSDSEKTTEIFVKSVSEDCVSIINEVLHGFSYNIIKQYSLSGAYLVDFDTIENADKAIDLLNERTDIKYAYPNYVLNAR